MGPSTMATRTPVVDTLENCPLFMGKMTPLGWDCESRVSQLVGSQAAAELARSGLKTNGSPRAGVRKMLSLLES